MRRLLLLPVLLLGLGTADALASDGHGSTTFNGRVSGLDAATITVRDGNRTVTCFLTSASPSVTSFTVGQHVKLACRKNVLVGITLNGAFVAKPSVTTTVAATTPTTATPPATTGISGTITALGTSSLTVHDGDRDLTCSLGATSPPLAGYAVGSHARIGCVAGVLASLAPVAPAPLPAATATTPPAVASTTAAPSTTTTATGKGTVTALSATSVTVTGDRALTCAIASSSPSPAGYGLGVGAHLTITCVNGVLTHVSTE